MKNYYEVLEVDKNASSEIIKKVFKIQIKNNHPDLFKSDKKNYAEEKTKLINEAYDTLNDLEKRKEYDNELNINTIDTDKLNEKISVLQKEIDNKNQIINHFLGDLDLSEYEYINNINTINPNTTSKYYKKDILVKILLGLGIILAFVITLLLSI